MGPEVCALCAAASRSYLAAGRFPYYYAQGKLRFDAVYLTLLRRGLIPDGARVIDLGCGQGLLAAVLLAARRQFEMGVWPEAWPPPPANLLLHGIELEDEIAQWGRIALGKDVRIETADVSEAMLPAADMVVLLDVLHYLERNAQLRLLENAARALARGGRLLMRVADASAGLTFRLTRIGDRLGTWLHFRQRMRSPRMTFRTASEWIALLQTLGFRVEVEPIDGRNPFANVLLHARIRTAE
jgi:SAM-dependent methyltransferase